MLLTGVLIAAAIISYIKIKQFENAVSWVKHSGVVKENLGNVFSLVKDAESGQRGYLLTFDTLFLQPYNSAERRINSVMGILDSLLSDNHLQHQRLQHLKQLIAGRFSFLKNSLVILKNQTTPSVADAALLRGKITMDEVRQQVYIMLREESLLLEKRQIIENRSAMLTPVFLLALSLISIVALTFFFFRLQRETSQHISTRAMITKKDEFISIASHEMATPITTAKIYIDLLLRSSGEESKSALYAAKAKQAIDRLGKLSAELLDATKIQHGKLSYNITRFDFNKLLDETIEDIRHGETKHILQKTGNSLGEISGDKDRLQQVLINLVSNAVKYSPLANKIIIRVEEIDNKIEVAVQDFGVGIGREHLAKIFDRYYRVREHEMRFQGLGIGLYISREIIRRHGGKMWAESDPGKGSIFYFALPVNEQKVLY